MSHPADVPDEVYHPYVYSGPGQRERLDRPLARVYHVTGVGLVGDGLVERPVTRAVSGHVVAEGTVGERHGEQPRQVALPGDAVLQPVDLR
jgi:hypothetical protein